MKPKLLIISEITESKFAVSLEDANRVYRWLDALWKYNDKIIVSFKDVEVTNIAFLNVAIGQLYSKYTIKQIDDKLSFIDTCEDDEFLLKELKENSIHYFENKTF